MTRTIRSVSVLLTLLFTCGPFTHAAPEREGRTVEVNGIEMYYEVMGEGDPLVLLHGWSGTGHDFDPFVEEFARHYRLIIPDLRGHGGSTNPSGEFSINQVAKDVAALLRQLEIDRIRAIGTSMGGITLLHMASLEQALRIESMRRSESVRERPQCVPARSVVHPSGGNSASRSSRETRRFRWVPTTTPHVGRE